MEMEDESVCVGMEEVGGSLDVTADHAALINTLSSSVTDCAAEHTAAEADRPALYRTLDALRVVPAPLKKPRLPLLHERPPTPPFPEDDGGTARFSCNPAAAGGGDGSSRVCLWLCAATSFLCFAALIAAAAAVAFKSSDELSRSFGELGRAFKDEGAAVPGAVLDPSTTRTAPSNRTTPTSGIALDVSKRPLNRTDLIFQDD
ncbi:hypothetical protein MTO96_020811 [Rhipicephalus appendiculatus]